MPILLFLFNATFGIVPKYLLVNELPTSKTHTEVEESNAHLLTIPYENKIAYEIEKARMLTFKVPEVGIL